MASKLKPFNMDEMKQELRGLLWGFMESMYEIYGADRAQQLMWPVGTVAKEGKRIERENYDLESLPITRNLEVMYRYAIDGVQVIPDSELMEMIDNYKRVISSIESFEHLWYDYADDVSMGHILALRDMANARAVVDFVGTAMDETGGCLWNHLTLDQVAILAGVDERTVRNATTPKASDRLETVKYGSRTFVERGVAVQWMKRRGYQETVFKPEGLARDIKDGFVSAPDLANYLVAFRESMGLTREQFTQRAGVNPVWYDSMEDSNPVFDREALAKLGEMLKVDARDFVLSVLKLCQRLEYLHIEEYLIHG